MGGGCPCLVRVVRERVLAHALHNIPHLPEKKPPCDMSGIQRRYHQVVSRAASRTVPNRRWAATSLVRGAVRKRDVRAP